MSPFIPSRGFTHLKILGDLPVGMAEGPTSPEYLELSGIMSMQAVHGLEDILGIIGKFAERRETAYGNFKGYAVPITTSLEGITFPGVIDDDLPHDSP